MSHECENCGAACTLRVGDDPTPNCDHCAHLLLEEALVLVHEGRRIAKYYLNHGSTPELQKLCRALVARKAAT